MSGLNNLVGQKFGKLTVLDQGGRSKDRHVLWNCVCDCGNMLKVASSDLVSGHSKSCGCLQKEITSVIRYKHGDRDARLYQIWKSMRKRCENTNCKSFQYYGAKGVSVCSDWQDYRAFKEWAMQSGYDNDAPYGACTLDRIDPFGDYEPSNCRWVDLKIQARNKRRDMRGGSDNG